MSKHDREIAAIRKLILQGMKMINSLAASQRKTDAQLLRFEGQWETDREAMRMELRELAASQRKTETTLERFIRSLEKGSNGHAKQS